MWIKELFLMSCLFAVFEICHRSHSPLCSLFQIPKPTKIQVKIAQLILSPLLNSANVAGGWQTMANRLAVSAKKRTTVETTRCLHCRSFLLSAVRGKRDGDTNSLKIMDFAYRLGNRNPVSPIQILSLSAPLLPDAPESSPRRVRLCSQTRSSLLPRSFVSAPAFADKYRT